MGVTWKNLPESKGPSKSTSRPCVIFWAPFGLVPSHPEYDLGLPYLVLGFELLSWFVIHLPPALCIFSFPKVPWLDKVSPYCLLLCLSYTVGSFSIFYSENLQFCNSGEKCNNWGGEPIVAFWVPPRLLLRRWDRLWLVPLGSWQQYFSWNWVLQVLLTFWVPVWKGSRKQNKMYTSQSTLEE